MFSKLLFIVFPSWVPEDYISQSPTACGWDCGAEQGRWEGGGGDAVQGASQPAPRGTAGGLWARSLPHPCDQMESHARELPDQKCLDGTLVE